MLDSPWIALTVSDVTSTSQKNTAVFHVKDSALGQLLADQEIFSYYHRRTLKGSLDSILADAMDSMFSLYDVAFGSLLPTQQERYLEASERVAEARRQATRVAHGIADELGSAARVYFASGLLWSLSASIGEWDSTLRSNIREIILELLDGVPFTDAFRDFRLGPSMLSTIAYEVAAQRGADSKTATKAQDLAYLLLTESEDDCEDVGLTLRGAVETLS